MDDLGEYKYILNLKTCRMHLQNYFVSWFPESHTIFILHLQSVKRGEKQSNVSSYFKKKNP